MNHKVKFKITDTIIEMQSKFGLEQFSKEEQKIQAVERFNNFFYNGNSKPDIMIKVNIVKKLPEIKQTKNVFITIHPGDNKENWRLMQRGRNYIYKSALEEKKQVMLVNETFDKVIAYLLPKKQKGWVWNFTDIIYDFLQVLMINYFALKKKGVFVHSIGVKDLDGNGLLFAGKSGAGKSTTAKLWYKHSKAMILNDDRIIVRKLNDKFFIYGSPWHGEFSDYLASRIESAPFKNLFFIHHASKNTIERISPKEAFSLLYPVIFPTFWDKLCLENIVSFCEDLVNSVPCYRLGFVKDRRIIEFVRRLDANTR